MDKADAVRVASIPLVMLTLSCTTILGIDKDYEEVSGSSSPASTGTTSGGGDGGSSTSSAGGFGGATSSTGGGKGGAGGGGGGGGSGGGLPCTGDGDVFEDPSTGHCYRRFTTNTNWPNARAECLSWGGPSADLAAVSGQLEYEFIVGVLGATFEMWLGGRDFDPADATVGYEWSNGEPWGYSPNGDLPASNPLEPCIRLKDDSFQTRACSAMHDFLCERD
jgi:Lectin C-type domain